MLPSPVDYLREIAELMHLAEENVFKVRAFERAAEMVSGRADLESRARAGTLTEIEGVGKGIAEVLTELMVEGRTRTRDELAAQIPPGLYAFTRIPGLGPKKARALIAELDIHTLAELEYACGENRLLVIKGFGQKMQDKVVEGIRFLKTTTGLQRLDEALSVAERLETSLRKALSASRADLHDLRISAAGTLRRRVEILDKLEFLIELPDSEAATATLKETVRAAVTHLRANEGGLLPVEIQYAASERWGYELAAATAGEGHWTALGTPKPTKAKDEAAFYESLGFKQVPPPESRETGEELKLAKLGKLELIEDFSAGHRHQIRGVFHAHTTASDGRNTLEEMVVAAKTAGYEYIGISDHSQSAVYAQGLKGDALKKQEKEIREVQDKHPEIRIFWGIESDILGDGSLDYDAKWLARFDFVIASIHTRYRADRDGMTKRLVAAIRNPATRFMGHLTGRILLGRPGYDLDFDKVFAEAAKRDVAIEINAHPSRLDVDWRHGSLLRKYGAKVSINPDAHEIDGLADTRFGIWMARKALLPPSQVINAASVKEVEAWLKRE